jgi:hypothetical protein
MHQSGFNPKARWDRHIPEDSDSATPESLSEKIECLALFRGAKILPQKFTWRNRDYEIKTVNYNWQERRGQEIINYFSVSTGIDCYQISFNNTTFGWRLDKIIT